MNSRSSHADYRGLRLVQDALDIVLRRLETLHPSPDVQALRAAAMRQLHEAESWERAWPPPDEQERVMKRVLGLHIGVSTIARQTPPPERRACQRSSAPPPR